MTDAMRWRAQVSPSSTDEPTPGLPADVIGFSPLSTALPSDAAVQDAVARSSKRGPVVLICVAIAALFAVLAVVSVMQSGSSAQQLTEDQLAVGDCLTGSNMGLDTSNPWPDTVTAVPCTQPHTAEVFYVGYPWPASLTTYPGDGVVNSTIQSLCDAAFVAYDGIDSSVSMYYYDYITPSGAWAEGAREAACVAYIPGSVTLHKSIKGSHQ
jgi:hypothetical protein